MIWMVLSVLATLLAVVLGTAILVALVAVAGFQLWRALLALVGLPMLVIGIAVLTIWSFSRRTDGPGSPPRPIVAKRAVVAAPQMARDLDHAGWPSGAVAEVSSQADFSAAASEQEAPISTDTQQDGTPPHADGGSDHRPPWVGAPPQRKGTIHSVSICSGPFLTVEECEKFLSQEVAGAVSQYNDWYLQKWGGSHGELIRSPRFDWDQSDPAKRYDEDKDFQIGKMHNLYLRLDFDEGYRSQLDQSWAETLVARRLTCIALAFGGMIAVLAMLNAYLRLDRATQQCYTRRLQCAAAGAILAFLGSGALLAHWIPWM